MSTYCTIAATVLLVLVACRVDSDTTEGPGHDIDIGVIELFGPIISSSSPLNRYSALKLGKISHSTIPTPFWGEAKYTPVRWKFLPLGIENDNISVLSVVAIIASPVFAEVN